MQMLEPLYQKPILGLLLAPSFFFEWYSNAAMIVPVLFLKTMGANLVGAELKQAQTISKDKGQILSF
jgi:hypothetical protein